MEFMEKRGQNDARMWVARDAIASVHDRGDRIVVHSHGGGEFVLFVTYDEFMAQLLSVPDYEEEFPAGEETEADGNLRRALLRIEQTENAGTISERVMAEEAKQVEEANGDDVVSEPTYDIDEEEPNVSDDEVEQAGNAVESAKLSAALRVEQEENE